MPWSLLYTTLEHTETTTNKHFTPIELCTVATNRSDSDCSGQMPGHSRESWRCCRKDHIYQKRYHLFSVSCIFWILSMFFHDHTYKLILHCSFELGRYRAGRRWDKLNDSLVRNRVMYSGGSTIRPTQFATQAVGRIGQYYLSHGGEDGIERGIIAY